MRPLILLALPSALALALVPRQGEGDPFPLTSGEQRNPKTTSSLPPTATAAAPPAQASSAALVALAAPRGSPTVCSNLTAEWAWRLPDSGSELFTLQIVPSSPSSSSQSTIAGLTTTSRSLSPSATPGMNGVIPGLARRAAAQTVSAALLVAQATFVWNPVAVPSGWYSFTGTPVNASITIIPSPPFFIAQGSSTACLASASTSQPAAITVSPTPDSAASAPKKRVNAGVVAGAVVGGFALGALICAAVWAVRARRQRETARWRAARAAQWSEFAAPRPSSTVGHDGGIDAPAKVDPDMVEREAAAREAVRALGLPGARPGA